jgi:AcrR family transcriptional regulator
MRQNRSEGLTSSRGRLLQSAKALFAERGYEPSSTSTICRLAGTSESQLIKHFGSKQGILEAIFEETWGQINPAIRLATESVPSAREKLKLTVEMVLNFLAKDPPIRKLFLLEGRRIRDDGRLVVLTPAFLDFVKMVDDILRQLQEQKELDANLHPHAVRSALMGAIEGMLRDKILSATSHFPAAYSDAEIRAVCFKFLNASLRSSG